MSEKYLERVSILVSKSVGENGREGGLTIERLLVSAECPDEIFAHVALRCEEVDHRFVMIDGVKRSIWFNVNGMAERGLGYHETLVFTGIDGASFPVIGSVLIESRFSENEDELPMFVKGLNSGEIRIGMVDCALENGVVKLVYH